MITINPFIELSALIPPIAMQIYIIAMFILVLGGTLLDTYHKKSAKYFFENSKKAKKVATRQVGGGEKVSIAIKTATNEVLTSAEFSNPKRRLAHILTMYGFIAFVVTTAIMVFNYPTATTATPVILPILWHVGALMLCIGGYWFWFFIRVDVSAEANPWYRLIRADLFIVSLFITATFALIWSLLQSIGTEWSMLALVLFISSSTFLFSTVLWSKFAHMFFKPAAAFQKRVTKADGSRENLPEITDKTRDSLVELKNSPVDMGLGIKREAPHHY